MYVDDTVDVLEEMPANVVDRLLLATDEDTRVKINALLQYPEAVSYTHLDVYKRQGMYVPCGESNQYFRYFTDDHTCLLYTSRCV